MPAMPIPSWADRTLALLAPLALAALAGCAAPATSGSALAPTALSFRNQGPSIRVVEGPRVVDVPIRIDQATIDADGDHEMRLIHRAPGFVVVLDDHASRPQPLSRCQAGREVYVRVLALAPAQERFSRLVESCLFDVVPGDPPVTWRANGTLTVDILSGGDGSRQFHVADDGVVTPR